MAVVTAPSLDVRRLRVLREVARTGSFSAAAEALAFTQPAVSRQIATLEAEAGTQLVERRARGIRLTPAGELLVEHAEVILDRLTAAEAQLEQLAGLKGGRLRVGAFPTANAKLVPLAIAAFASQYPEVELRLQEALTRDLLGQLASGEVDIAIVAEPNARTDDPDIALEPLMEDPLNVALPLGHPLVDRKSLTMADLADETWIEGRDPVSATPLHMAAAAAGFEPRIAFQSAQWLGKLGLVAAGAGVTLIPTLALATVRDDLVLRRIDDPLLRRQIFIATLCCGYRSPAIAPMRDILLDVAAQHCFACDARVR